MGQSFGFSPAGYSQIILFTEESDFREIVAANPNMTAIMGADDHTKNEFPGLFVAGIKANSQMDKAEGHPRRIEPETKYCVCKKCGKEWHYSDARYCGNCGEKLKEAPAESSL